MTHASVFSGIGGPEIAATMLGWNNVFHCEINPFGRAVLDYWYPKSKSYEDITKTDFSEWRGKVDVLTGGFPCQPFSYAGKRRGADDDRYLWPYMFKCIDQIIPDWVVAENVAGITAMVEQGEVSKVAGTATLFDAFDDLRGRFELRETFTLQRICDDLESHGYSVQPVLVPACAVGAPHRRDRVFIIGRRVAANTDMQRCNQSKPATNPGKAQRFDSQADTDWRDTERAATDTESKQGERLRPKQPEVGRATQEQSGGRSGEDGHGWNASDSSHPRRPVFATKPGEPKRLNREEDYKRGIAGLKRWDTFPSVSPVHRGNDGLPFDVDDLAIPFSKWRTESLEAYCNAIVPQVIYEIFRAIDLIETNKRMEAANK